MSVVDEKEGFTLTANVLSPGYVSIIPTGHIISRRSDGVYHASFLPQMFLGFDGSQLSSWRQYVSASGSQVVLTKPPGDLLVPRNELYWVKDYSYEPSHVSEPVQLSQGIVMAEANQGLVVEPYMIAIPLVAVGAIGLYYLFKKKKKKRR